MFYKKTSFLLQIFKFDSIAVSLLIENFIEIYWQVKIDFSFSIFQIRFSLVSLYFDGPFNTFCCLEVTLHMTNSP